MNKLSLFNTLTRQKEIVQTIHDSKIGMYSCGPTVYDYAHIGHSRNYITNDLLRRTLETFGFNVTQVMNITDVGHLTSDADSGDDKMEKSAREKGKTVWEIAKFYTDDFFGMTSLLNIQKPHIVCKATDHIKDQIALIQKLEEKELTYQTDDGIYFDTSKLNDYGKLAHMDRAKLIEGIRVEINPQKKNPTDFALWKFSPPNQQRAMEWESPWGVGFPGWHIECSAMSMKYLGEQFEIHTGGIDHIPIHHTNEIAQSEGASGKIPFVKYWIHGAFLTVNGEKMSKSKKNFYRLQDVMAKGYHPLAFRYLTLQTHYRKTMNFTWESLDAANTAYTSLIAVVQNMSKVQVKPNQKHLKRFFDALANDLNAPKGLSVLWEIIHSNLPQNEQIATLFECDQILGLGFKNAKSIMSEIAAKQYKTAIQPSVKVNNANQIPTRIRDLVKEREQARAKSDWVKADKLRSEINKNGFEVEDLANETKLRKI